jgi:phage minor structural protein
MIPKLFESSATEFTTNGLGLLNGASSCSVRQVLNGEYELQFTYPINGARFPQLVERALVIAKPDPISNDQAFRIYRIVKSMKDTVTIYAEHISYDLGGIPVKPFTAPDVGTALISLKENMVVDSPFTFVTDKTTTVEMSLSVPYSTRSVLGGVEGSILDTYRGEYEWDNFTVHLWNKRGDDRGVHIRYGKNLTNFEQDSKCSNMYTGVYPYWTQEGDTVMGDLITLVDETGYNRVLSLDLSSTFQQRPSVEELNLAAQAYVSSHDLDKPAVSWKVSFASLENTTEYAGKNLLEGIYLGDTVHVYFEKLGISVNSRAVETNYDPILERYNSVTLGSVKTNLSDTIISQEKSLQEVPTRSLVESISSSIAGKLIGINGGCIRQLDTNGDGEPDELYIADDPDPLKALKVWRFNYMGWAVSKTGYNGPFTMGATIEDGFLADFITAANLTAGIIQSRDKKSFYLNLDTGVLRMDATSIALNGNELGDFINVTYDDQDRPVITLGWSGNNIRLNLLNDRINFTDANNQELAYWTTDSFRLKTLQSFQLGNMKMVAQESGSVSFIEGDA